MSDIEIKNAKISSTMLGVEDHGIMSFYLYLDYGGSCQGFGGWAIDDYDKVLKRRVGTAFGTEMIMRILEILEVSTWEKLPGTVCRVEASFSKVYKIGHFLKDKWFDPTSIGARL